MNKTRRTTTKADTHVAQSRGKFKGGRDANNPTIVFPEPNKVVLEDRPVPEPGDGELLIRTHCSLISTGTELSMLGGNFPKDSYWDNYVKYPVLPGYCNVGTVVEIGKGVDPSWIGRRVGSYANHARFSTVRAFQEPGASQTNLDGQLSITIPSPWVLPRPIVRDIPDEHAVFFTIGEIVMNGVRRSNVRWGESVVVFGLGLLGQLAVQLCRLAGARPILAVDVSPKRLANLPNDPSVIGVNPHKMNLAETVAQSTRGRKADVVFEVTGNSGFIPEQFGVLHNQGRFVVLSSPVGKTAFDFHDLCNAPSHTIIGAHNFSHPADATLDNPWTNLRDGELFFDLVADNALQIAPLISHRINFNKAPEFYLQLVESRSEAMGIVINWEPN